ncbi:flagellar protein FlbD [Orenia metallireducens]|uniref:Flagellar protein FlbD n=1 Tax=Orenia metallireducens TaxID=1413210 RepID=A0A285FQG9_9FIRM|nr:flagellar FlbD family protein [Orenia metallireducens]PRX33668.1 flagellar protein FlbD [Orenia metallireducens]SNY13084.1 flagellar protein FlbD [Orenia metallireducens]
MSLIIELTRLNDSKLVINAELIETIESTPDTVITLTTNHRLVVKEDVEEVVAKVVDYKKKIAFRPE